MNSLIRLVASIGFLLTFALPVQAAGPQIGQIKVASGTVSIVRDGTAIPAKPGEALYESDTIETGENSAVGMTFSDNSRMSLGPKSSLSLESYAFNRPGKKNGFDARLSRGSLTAASGEIVKARPLAMRVLMPTTVLGVKGTEFAVRVSEEG